MNKLVFFVGTAGTGKSYIARVLSQHFSWAYLDMDTVGTRFVNKMLTMSGRSADDRDSKFYKEHLRDLPYEAITDLALENLEAKQNAALIAPFTKELAIPNWIDEVLKRKGFTIRDVDIKVMIIEVENTEIAKQRIEARGFSRDEWKLEHWDEFKERISAPEIAWNIPDSSILKFDNSGLLTEEKLEMLIRFIKGEES
ncbi:AAA family ATPase [Bacillus taeanensis]|uniref:ATP-binding protein n=1 Tax=Bacillus taeanensis TaxID=273032 RepID=A0A366XU45_9BACI|nr:AAA family ATPase [Bacillus taeanensis]RBW68289.1 ATP-binding protein [Bacillus taeanensis]